MQIRTSLGNTHGCNNKTGLCTLPHQGVIVWETLRNQSCWFTTWSIKSGELHGINWLSSDKTLALNFTEHGFIPFRLCPDDQSQSELMAWKSDQDIYVTNLTAPTNQSFPRQTAQIAVPSSSSAHTTGMIGLINSVSQSLSESIGK